MGEALGVTASGDIETAWRYVRLLGTIVVIGGVLLIVSLSAGVSMLVAESVARPNSTQIFEERQIGNESHLVPFGALSEANVVNQIPAKNLDPESIVRDASKGQLTVIAERPSAYGLLGLALAPTNGPASERLIGYIMPGQRALMIGTLLGSDGANLTAQLASEMPPPKLKTTLGQQAPTSQGVVPHPLSGAFNLQQFQRVNEGTGPVHLTIFFDPNCVFCNYIWREIHSIPDYGKRFSIAWVPLGFLQPTSAGEAAAILKSGGSSGLADDEENFSTSPERGGITPSFDQKYLDMVEKNNDAWSEFMAANKLQEATPTIVIDGRSVMVGAPPASQLNALSD